jgi:hypothetical protein
MSPMADGPIKFIGSVDGKEMHVENITRFGRNFSIVCVPYTFKLLLQELQTANIQMRLITEDNIEQLENLSFSKNISKLTQISDVTTAKVIEMTKENLMESRRMDIARTPLNFFENSPEESPKYVPYSPPYAPGSPAYVPGSPNYSPSSPPFAPRSSDSPPPKGMYEPTSPDFPPPQGMYEPTSPDFSPPQGMYEPTSPDFPPPPDMKGGESKEFQRGEIVFLRGGSKPNRQWFIKDIGGGEFVTIETNDLDGISDIQDSIKVVYPTDIFRPSEIVYNTHPVQTHQQQMYSQEPMMIPNMNNGMPNIEVNPVIKIVNGPDNSVDTSTTGKPEQPYNDVIIGGTSGQSSGETNSFQKSSVIKTNDVNEAPIDFNKLVIKKV